MSINGLRESGEIEWLIQKLEIVRAAWKLILIGFLTLSVLGATALYAIAQPTYSSHMVLPLTPNLEALIYTDAILAPALRKLRSANTSGVTMEREGIASKLVVTELKKGSGLFSISVTDHSAQGAQDILNQLLAEIAIVSKPSGSSLASAQQQIEAQKRALAELKELSAVLKENASRAKGGSDGEQYTRSFVVLIAEIAAKEQRIWELQTFLEGFKLEDVVVPPNLASRPDAASFSRKLALILLLSLLLPVCFVLLRDLWRRRGGSGHATSSLQRAA
jgi:hypothetical protein